MDWIEREENPPPGVQHSTEFLEAEAKERNAVRLNLRRQKREASAERNAEFAESQLNARRIRSDEDAERVEALLWAEANGVDAPWLDGSLRKMQRDRHLRADGYDPDTGKKVSPYVTGGVFIDWKKP